MGTHDQRVNLIVNRGRQLGRSLMLLAYHVSVFAVFVARSVRWVVEALRWLSLFARYTTSMFDSIYRLLHWGRRKSGPEVKEVCPAPASTWEWWRSHVKMWIMLDEGTYTALLMFLVILFYGSGYRTAWGFPSAMVIIPWCDSHWLIVFMTLTVPVKTFHVFTEQCHRSFT